MRTYGYCVDVVLRMYSFPGMLDNSVAGGIPGGTTAFDSIVKEAAEEASLDTELVRKRVRTVGAVSYYYQTKTGWLQPEVEYVYDMCVEPGEVRLAPMDGEVESFEVRIQSRFFPFRSSSDTGRTAFAAR